MNAAESGATTAGVVLPLPEDRTPAQRKLDSKLLQGVLAANQGGVDSAVVNAIGLNLDGDNRVMVEIGLNDTSQPSLDRIVELGGTISSFPQGSNRVFGKFPLIQLETLAGENFVAFVSRALPPVTNTPVPPPAPIVPLKDPYAVWLENHFNKAERANPEITAARADPDQDGYTNLAEYAFGLNPLAFDRGGSRFSIRLNPGDRAPLLSFPQRRGDPALDYVIQSSAALGDWRAIGDSLDEVGVTIVDSDFEEVVLKDRRGIGADQVRFYRLVVTRSTP